jgi:homoserine kinase
MTSFKILTPCSSANLGPGFDVMGLALSMYLELHVTINKKESSELPLNCSMTFEGQGKGTDDISLDPEVNLITRVALYVLRCHGQRSFPAETHIHIVNPIPLGRGLGSSAAAVVGGVVLGNEIGGLGLDKRRLLDYCLMIGERARRLDLQLLTFDKNGIRTTLLLLCSEDSLVPTSTN